MLNYEIMYFVSFVYDIPLTITSLNQQVLDKLLTLFVLNKIDLFYLVVN